MQIVTQPQNMSENVKVTKDQSEKYTSLSEHIKPPNCIY